MRWRFCFMIAAAAGAPLVACGSSADSVTTDGNDADAGLAPLDGSSSAQGHDASDASAASSADAASDGAGSASGDDASDAAVSTTDALADASPGTDAHGLDGSTGSRIKHVVLVVQENHTFDAYFGAYCTAAAGSSPTCTTGPACCEAPPATEPSGASPKSLTDSQNSGNDLNHAQSCEVAEINGGAMDRYVSGGGSGCSSANNFAIAPAATVKAYHDFAAQYAIGDRYFQPIAGASSSNDMYLAVAKHVFTDNAYEPTAYGHTCLTSFSTPSTQYTNQTTIADVLLGAGFTFSVYAQGYKASATSATHCPAAPSDCSAHIPGLPCDFDPADIPFEYYAQFTDKPQYVKDYDSDFAGDIAAHTLPSFSYVKALQYHNEHPGYGTTISAGVQFVQGVVSAVQGSTYKDDTLILVVWDEGGGFYDHVAPPPTSTVDQQPYGTRVPFLAIGPFTKQNYVSHVTMEHSSIVKFLEYNFTGTTGQLGARDAVVNNIGSVLDPQKTGIAIPEN